MGTREAATQEDKEVSGEAEREAPEGGEMWGLQDTLHEGSLVIFVTCCSEVTSMKVETNRLVKLKVMGSPGKGEVCEMHVTSLMGVG